MPRTLARVLPALAAAALPALLLAAFGVGRDNPVIVDVAALAASSVMAYTLTRSALRQGGSDAA